MGRLVGQFGALAAYFCVATVLSAVAAGAFLRFRGTLSDEKLERLQAVLQGTELPSTNRETASDHKEPDSEQPSYEDREQARDLWARNLELREQALNSRLDFVRSEQSLLVRDKDRNERLKTAFKEQLASLRDKTLSSGRENVRLIWENIKPKQAKEQVMQMLESGEINEVVAILSAMPIERRAKIVMEFKTKEDAAKLDEILRLIREGVPEANLIDKTISQMQP